MSKSKIIKRNKEKTNKEEMRSLKNKGLFIEEIIPRDNDNINFTIVFNNNIHED